MPQNLIRTSLSICAVALALLVSVAPSSAHDSDHELNVSSAAGVSIAGHGWGHGRGMGQFGALGYAVDEGWTSAQILDHFYGATSAGSVGNSLMTVRLLSRDNDPLVVTVASGTQLAYRVGTNGALNALSGQTARVDLVGVNANGLGIYNISTANTCTSAPSLVTQVTAGAAGFNDHVAIVAVTGGGAPPPPPDPDGGFAYGSTNAIPLTGDWNGDGIDTVGYRVGNSNLFHLRNSNSAGADSVAVFSFGIPSDIPLAGDFNGDGTDEIGIFRPSDRTWHFRGLGGPVTFGSSGNIQPVVGDWNGDGTDDFAAVSGTTWQFDENLSGGAPEFVLQFDAASDIPIGGNTEPDNGDDRNGYDISAQTFLLGTGAQRITKQFGPAGAIPVLGDWNGDGLDEVGTFLNGNWLLDLSGTGAAGTSRAALTPVDNNAPNLALNQTLQLCTSNSTNTYRGELRAAHFQNEQRTVNAVAVEQYLRAVVPRESPASWADLGGGTGMAALESQAVAARSYSLAENRYNYAKTCDTISCQVYGARLIGSFRGEDSRTDAAIANTGGVVRMRGGSVARTEFSSSTGGYTAGGVFPAVVDAGDDISSNPNHDWLTSVTRTRIENFFGIGALDTVAVTQRNGLGEDGGRPTKVRFTFVNGASREISGTSFQASFGLKSDWFSFAGVVDPPPPAAGPVPTTLYVSNTLTTGVAELTFEFGDTSQEVLAGDWNGDGKTTFLLRTGDRFQGSNTLSANLTDIDFRFGRDTDDVISGDWDGDGRDTLAIRRGNEFFISNTLGSDAVDAHFSYGIHGDQVYVGDWDGDQIDTFTVRRGNIFFAKNTVSGGIADRVFGYGRPSDEPIVGDWNKNGRDSIAVRRSNRFLVSNELVTSVAEFEFAYGRPADRVLVGDFDGDGVQTITVLR